MQADMSKTRKCASFKLFCKLNAEILNNVEKDDQKICMI